MGVERRDFGFEALLASVASGAIAALKEAGISVILGSKSFTRKAILKEMGIPYEVAVADIDEKAIGDRLRDKPEELVLEIGRAKAAKVLAELEKQQQQQQEEGGVGGGQQGQRQSPLPPLPLELLHAYTNT